MMKKIFSLFLLVTLMVSNTACSKADATPSDTVSGFINAFKSQNNDEMNKYVSEELTADTFIGFSKDVPDDQKEFNDILLSKMKEVDYKIIEEKITEETAIVKVEITANNLGDKFKEGIGAAFTSAFASAFSGKSEEESSAEMNKIIADALGTAEKTFVETVDVQLSKVEKAWVISNDKSTDLFDALTGGMVSMADELSASLDQSGN